MADGIFDRVVSETGVVELGGSGGIAQNPQIVIGYGAPPTAVQPSTGSIYLRRDAPNAALMLYVAAASLWWPVSASVFSDVSVNTEAALTAFDVSSLPDGALAHVGNPAGGVGQSQGSTWQLVTQIAATPVVLAHEVIASSANGRVWVRLLDVVNPRWIQQAAWFVDPIAGDDQNNGSTNGTALLTYAEYIRRVPYLYLSQTVTINSTLPDSDNLVHSPEIRWHQSLAGTMPILTIAGVRTLGANKIVASSSDEAANAAPLVDAGFAFTIGTIVQATSGASSGATAVILAVVAGTNFRTTPWRSAAGARVAPPAPADTIAATSRPTVNVVSISVNAPSLSGAVGAQVTDLDIKIVQPTNPATYTVCTFAGTQVVGARLPVQITYLGCSFTTTGATGSAVCGSSTIYRQCGFVGVPGRFSWAEGAYVEATDCVLQNFTIDFGSTLGSGARGLVRSLGIFYTNAGTGFFIGRGSNVHIEGTLYGPNPGGASTGTNVRNGGQIEVLGAVTPTLTGATELIVDTQATALPNLLPSAGAVLPNAAALATWAQWAAGPFNRNVVGTMSGARINTF